MAVRKTMRDFALWTSASGVPHIGRAQSTCMRMFWLIVFLGCLVMFAYQMWVLVGNYLEFKVNVNTQLEFRTLPFPAVTICNLNPYKKSNVAAFPDLQALMDGYASAVNRNLTAANDVKWNFTQLNDTMAIQARARDHMMYYVVRKTDAEKRSISYTQAEFIRGCSFNSKSCDASFSNKISFTPIMDPTFGQCFTFNGDPTQTVTASRAGPSYGLRVLLATDLSEYLTITESAGVRVTVTGQGESVFPDAFGYNAAAGFTTSFALQYKKTSRLGQPYGNCTSLPSTQYSVEGCFRKCLQKYLVDTCKCCDPAFNCTIDGASYCTNDKLSCISGATGSGSKNASSGFNAATACDCPELCQGSDYDMTVSTGNWPSSNYVPPYCKNQLDGNKTNGLTMHEWCAQNTMMIEVFFERMNFQSLTETEQYGIESLISDFGGQIGLWIGVSVITLVEFIFFPCLLCCACCWKKHKHLGKPEEYDEEDNEFDKILGAANSDPPPPYPGGAPGYNAFNNNPNHQMPNNGRSPNAVQHDPYTGLNKNFDLPPTVAR